ncbi:siderophore-interacting protein [Paludibacterium paludis]|uniref:Siderophore-interacting protein n=1 Tax=Paludibacterium paludis TaxID=1225769 RepID=A0A918P6L1_9NEIS|nr:siderophore-interacting protein [Paludibacterium paludis]GGY26737.1 siderophore-interacting protein [Paludibacterium paludis]
MPDANRTAHRVADVLAVRAVTPHMRRITVGGADIAGFLLADGVDEPAAWVKVFLPSGEGRAYTIRRIDRRSGTLDLDFVLHGPGPDSGPASAWASRAREGERIGIAGPRSGGFRLPDDARWVMLAGDATALPGIQSIAERLPAGIEATIHLEVRSPADRQPVESLARLRLAWLDERQAPGAALCQAVQRHPLPPGPGYVWMAGESGGIRQLKRHFLQERGLDPRRVGAKGYWKAGEADHRDA